MFGELVVGPGSLGTKELSVQLAECIFVKSI